MRIKSIDLPSNPCEHINITFENDDRSTEYRSYHLSDFKTPMSTDPVLTQLVVRAAGLTTRETIKIALDGLEVTTR